MSSDTSDRNIVIFMFLFFYIYLAYIRTQIDIMKDWKEIRCNPLYLFISSYVVSNDKSISNFEKCVNQMAATTIDNRLSKANLQQSYIAQNIASMSENIVNNNDDISTSLNEINSRNNDISNNIVNIVKIQNTNKELIGEYDASNNSINKFTNKVNEIFNNIKQYLPNIKI